MFGIAGMLISRSWNISLLNASTLHRHTGKAADIFSTFVYLTDSRTFDCGAHLAS